MGQCYNKVKGFEIFVCSYAFLLFVIYLLVSRDI